MLKFATAQIIAASLGDQQRVTKAAHRAVFQYEARPGFLYVRSRAISSRCNDNYDEFPAEEIEKSYRTFVGKPVFVNHVNDNHRRARGVIIDAALHQDRNPDGTPDTWAEVLMEIDAVRFPKLAKAILAGEIDRTSMGCDVERSVCSACGNEARTPAEYCSHIPHLKGKRIFRATASGKKVGELVRETCFGLRFFENSVLVEPPADPTAHFLGVDSSGLGKAASKSAAIDYSQFEDHDDLEADDDGEHEAPKPKPAHPAEHAKPPVKPVPYDGTTHDHKRRQDAVTHAKPFTPLKPSLNGLQTAASRTASLPVGSPFCLTCGHDLELARTNHGASWQHAGGLATGHPGVPHDGRTFNQEAARQDDAAMWTPEYPTPRPPEPPRTAAKTASQGLSWDDIGARHPHIYGDPEVHGEAADGADGEMIGWAANNLAHSHPDDPDAEHHHVSELTFHRTMVDPNTIDHKRHGSSDGRVASAVEGYRKNPEKMPPLVLVHRHGVFQVADGHHRAEAAKEAGLDKVPAYVAKSPYPNKPDGWGDRGPFHGAEKTRWTPPKTKETPAAPAPQWEQQKLFEARRKAALRVEAGKAQYEDPGEHPWFQATGLSHEHILRHWDQATDEEKAQGARWYPDAHHVAKAIAKLHPDITDDREAAHKGAGVLSAYSPQQNWWANMHNAARSFVTGRAVGKGEGLMVMGSHANAAQKILDGEDHQKVLKGPKTQDFAHLIEHAGNDEHGQPSKRVVMDRHALSVAAGRRLSSDDAAGFPSASRHYYEHAAEHYRRAAAVISDREGRHVPPHEVQAVTWLARQRLNSTDDASPGQKGRETVQRNQRQQWKDLAGEHAPELKEQGNSHVARVIDATFINDDGTIRVEAYGEIKAPADVDTLREENCPVCGDKDTFDGIQCQICGFINPPEQFRDPDLDKAKQLDLRKQIVDPQLVDDNGELQRVNDDGTGMPQEDGEPGDEEPQLGPDGQPLADDAQQMVDPEQLDENGLPPSPYGDQSFDGTQQDGPAVSDRNGDGIIQPDEIDPDGNLNVQPQMVDPEQGGQAGPRELPGRAKDRTGDPFTPGPDMPRLTGPEGPMDGLDDDDDSFQAPGMGSPQEPILAHPGDYTGDESETPHWSWNRDVSEEPQGPGQFGQAEEDEEDPRRRRMFSSRTAATGQAADGVPDLGCPHCGFAADATPPRTQDVANPQSSADGIVAGDVCPKCRKAQLLTPAELQGESSVPPPAVPQFPRT